MLLREKIVLVLVSLVALLVAIDINTTLGSKIWERYTGLTDRFAIHQNFKLGYINQRGRIVIKPQYDQAVSHFSEGIVPVSVDRRWGYIDIHGDMVIKPQFRLAREFSEGLAVVAKADRVLSRQGFIDPNGEFAIDPKFREAKSFSEGLAAVLENEKWGYIDRSGKYVIQPLFDDAKSFSEGLAAVQMDDKWGYIVPEGYLVIDTRFDDAKSFSQGLAPVSLDRLWGYIDQKEFLIIEFQYDFAEPFSEGLAAVGQGYLMGYIDRLGERKIETLNYNQISKFSDGLARVKVRSKDGYFKDGLWGYINPSGRMVIPPKYDWAWDFSGGFARVGIGENSIKRGYINKKGTLIWDPAQWEQRYVVHQVLKNIILLILVGIFWNLFKVYSERTKEVFILNRQAVKRGGKVEIGGLLQEPKLHFTRGGIDVTVYRAQETNVYGGLYTTYLQMPLETDEHHFIAFYARKRASRDSYRQFLASHLKSEDPDIDRFYKIDSLDSNKYVREFLIPDLRRNLLKLNPLCQAFVVSVAQKKFMAKFNADIKKEEDYDLFIETGVMFYERFCGMMKEKKKENP